jgi:hypothetical protein
MGVRCSCRHGRMMDAFDIATRMWWDAAEAATSLYETELAEWKKDHPMPNLRDFMGGQY